MEKIIIPRLDLKPKSADRKRVKIQAPLPAVEEEQSKKSTSTSGSRGQVPPTTFLNQGPSVDVMLAEEISSPAVINMTSLRLHPQVTPTCLTMVNESEIVVGTKDHGLLVTDLAQERWIRLPGLSSITGMKNLGRLLACSIDRPTDNLCLVDIDHPEGMMFLKGHSRGVSDTVWTDNAKNFISVGKDGKLVFWNWDPLEQIKTLKISNLPVNSVTILAKSNTVVTGGDDSTIKIFSLSQGNISYKSSIKDSAPVTKVDSFYQNTKFIASTNLLGEIKIWDVASEKYVFFYFSCLKTISTGAYIEGMIKITSQPGNSNQTEIRMMVCQRGNPVPLLLSVNEDNKVERLAISPVAINSRVKASSKMIIQKSDPLIGFSFVALTENNGIPLVQQFNFLPNFHS